MTACGIMPVWLDCAPAVVDQASMHRYLQPPIQGYGPTGNHYSVWTRIRNPIYILNIASH